MSMSIVSARNRNSCGTFGGMIMMSPALIRYLRPCENTSARPSVNHVICSFGWWWSGITAPFFTVHFTNVELVPCRYCREIRSLIFSMGWVSRPNSCGSAARCRLTPGRIPFPGAQHESKDRIERISTPRKGVGGIGPGLLAFRRPRHRPRR
jgi:hypothetical protein